MNEVPISDEISVVYDASDFRALYRACRRCKRTALLVLIGVPLFFGFLSYADGVHGVALIYYTLPYVLIALLILAGIYFIGPWNLVRMRTRNGWGEPMLVRFTDQGVSTHHPSQDSLFFWAKIQDVIMRGQRLFLFTSPGCAIILPRHSFADEAQFTRWHDEALRLWNLAKGGA
jgi:hypothetical protein